MSKGLVVVAIGGNSLIKDKQHQTVRDQYIAAQETCHHIVTMIKDGWGVAITHGNASPGRLHPQAVRACRP